MWGINWSIQSWWIITFDPNKNPDEDKISFITRERVSLEKPISQENYLDMIKTVISFLKFQM
jgi:hypothetical protein